MQRTGKYARGGLHAARPILERLYLPYFIVMRLSDALISPISRT